MHLVYSAINTTNNSLPQPPGLNNQQPYNELLLRYQAYQTTCNKYCSEIAAIQEYIPGWMPEFR
ncbi:MAG TPA: hypothetical protein VIJ27_02445 [Mucilaginibacter sp.]